jgi:putative lipoprotein
MVALLMTCAGACAELAQGAMPGLLAGGEWIVERVAGATAGGDRRARISFAADGQVTGSGGCNRLMGRAEIGSETITFGALATTRMACPPEVMQQERKLLDALSATRSYRIADVTLTLHDASGAELVRLTRQT